MTAKIHETGNPINFKPEVTGNDDAIMTSWNFLYKKVKL